MSENLDVLIIGGGPAGLSAAINCTVRGKKTMVISNGREESGLYKAERIDNYPGLPAVSGKELSDKISEHAAALGITVTPGRIQNILPMGDELAVGFGSDILMSKTVILATGIVQGNLYSGEAELLGRGVSYCATCDGMLYRGKTVCVICIAPDAEQEADYLSSIGCNVIKIFAKHVRIQGEDRVHSIIADGDEIACDGVFIFRRTIAPSTLLPGIELENGHLFVNRRMETSVPGVFAAGDCTGRPYQIAKAVGEGQVAGLSAVDFIDESERMKKA